MTKDDLCYTPATELAALIASRALSPVEVVGTILERIAALEEQVNAFAYLDADRAMAAARRAERAVVAGEPLGPLHGVPVTVKDLAITADMPTQFGSHLMAGNRPAETAPFVTRLEQAGAIVLGKTTTSEFGWSGVSYSPLTGVTHNPWRHGLNAGASSAGAGAACAAGFGPLHQGSDGAGSIRMPAHFSGVVGLKPTYGRVPQYPVSTADYTTHIGPLTRTVADAALMLRVMAGAHPLDHTSCGSLPADYGVRFHDGIRGKRVAYSPDLGHARVDPDVAALARAAAARFEALGARVEEVPVPWAKDGPELARLFWSAHFTRLAPKLPEWEARMDRGLVALIRAGLRVSMTDYMLARERKAAYIAAAHRWFEDWDLLLTPAVSVAAFPADRIIPEHWPQHDWDWLSWAEFSYPFNLTGDPAVSVPCGFTKQGLPVGLQIVGRRFDDLGVLQAAAAFEDAQGWAASRPVMRE